MLIRCIRSWPLKRTTPRHANTFAKHQPKVQNLPSSQSTTHPRLQTNLKNPSANPCRYHLSAWAPTDPRWATQAGDSAKYLAKYQALAKELQGPFTSSSAGGSSANTCGTPSFNSGTSDILDDAPTDVSSEELLSAPCLCTLSEPRQIHCGSLQLSVEPATPSCFVLLQCNRVAIPNDGSRVIVAIEYQSMAGSRNPAEIES